MLQIEKLKTRKGSKYFIVELSERGRNTLATVYSLEKAGCLLRFLSGANIKGTEYILAVETMREIDREEAERLTAKNGVLTGTEGTNEETDENVSGEVNNGVSVGSTTD